MRVLLLSLILLTSGCTAAQWERVEKAAEKVQAVAAQVGDLAVAVGKTSVPVGGEQIPVSAITGLAAGLAGLIAAWARGRKAKAAAAEADKAKEAAGAIIRCTDTTTDNAAEKLKAELPGLVTISLTDVVKLVKQAQNSEI